MAVSFATSASDEIREATEHRTEAYELYGEGGAEAAIKEIARVVWR